MINAIVLFLFTALGYATGLCFYYCVARLALGSDAAKAKAKALVYNDFNAIKSLARGRFSEIDFQGWLFIGIWMLAGFLSYK